MALSLEVSIRGLSDALTAFLADANVWSGPLDHSEARNKRRLVSVQLTSAGGTRDIVRIKERISEIKFHLQKIIVDNESERRNSAIKPIDERLSYSTRIADKLLLRVTDIERIVTDDEESSFFRVPHQSSAPIRVAVVDDVLRMDRGHLAKTKDDAPNLVNASRYLSAEYKAIEQQLAKTNLDRRFLDLFSHFEELFVDNSDVNVISLGMHVTVVGEALAPIKDEMPSLLAVEVSGFVVNVRNYINQFEDWQLFVKNSRAEDMEQIEISELVSVTNKLKHDFEHQSSIVSFEIPKGISFVLSALHAAAESAIVVAYAVVKSVENVFIGLLKYLFDKARELAKKSIDNTIDLAAKGVPYAFVILVLSLYPDASPLIQKITSLSWIEDAMKLVEAIFMRK